MSSQRLEIGVSFAMRGYFTTGSEPREPVVALSLGGLRRRIEIVLLPDALDGLAERAAPLGGDDNMLRHCGAQVGRPICANG